MGLTLSKKKLGNSTLTEASVNVEQRNGKNRETEWLTLEVWGRSGEALAQHARKGDSIFAIGEISLDRWTGRDSQSKCKLKMRCDRWEFAGSKRDQGDRTATPVNEEIAF